MPSDGYNWFLILVAIIASVVLVLINVYILVHFQHPEDRNQAWFPKLVVVRAPNRSTTLGLLLRDLRPTHRVLPPLSFASDLPRLTSPAPYVPRSIIAQILGLTLAEMSILLLPLDVANRAACADSIVLSACNFALPMEQLWYAVYMSMFVMMVAVVPFTLFYYEQDHDMSAWGKTVSSGWWIGGTVVVLALILGLCYGFLGFVDFPVTTLTSGLAPLGSAALDAAHKCVAPETFASNGVNNGYACDADGGVPTETWSVRTTFPVYVIAVGSILSWVLFIAFGGVGVSAIPIDLVKSFQIGRAHV